jgi:predicted nucleic-acid-binding Zn-ribbon protein
MKRKKLGPFLTVLALAGLTLACGLPYSINASRAQSTDQKEPESALTCPKCKGTMEAGIILDYWDNTFNQTQWTPGNPRQHLFKKMPTTKNVFTYRCTNCGYLESYAK